MQQIPGVGRIGVTITRIYMQLARQSKSISVLTYALILSILLHFLFIVSMGLVWTPISLVNTPPATEVPAYFYRDEPQQPSGAAQQQVKPEPQNKHADIIEKPQTNTKPQAAQPQPQKIALHPSDEEPIHMIGDKTKPPKPLAKIIGRALTKKLAYPKIAVDFRLRGIVYVGFSIHPDGTLTGIELVQSSNAGVLDKAALEAVNAITPLKNVSAYVSKPKYLVIGIIFR